MNKITLGPEDFNIEVKWPLFTVLYEATRESTVKSWVVIGHILNSSSDCRAMEHIVNSYPISIYVSSNKRTNVEAENSRFFTEIQDAIDLVVKEKEQQLEQFKQALKQISKLNQI